MVNDGDARDRDGTIYLTAHEIGHSYFPFYTGLNEQKYAWMDEGLISFIPQKVVAKYSDNKDYNPYRRIISGYNRAAGTEMEIPLMIPSTNAGEAYRYQAYTRSATAFYMLHELIGADQFKQGLQEFAKNWNGKHPIPIDFFNTFNKIANEDLGWFWKPWFLELGYADLALSGSIVKESIEIINKGGFPVPINLKVTYENGDVKEIKKKASIWKNGDKSVKIKIPKGKVKKIELDTENTPDAFPENNILEIQ